jgi:Aspartyl protease
MKEISFKVVELEENAYHILIEAEFKGLENGWWIIDTGASRSVFDQAMTMLYVQENSDSVLATGLGKEMVETGSGSISDLVLGDVSWGVLRVALVDFHHINHEYSKFTDKKIIGLLGADFLLANVAKLDFKEHKIWLGSE